MLNDQGLPQRCGLDNYLQRNKACIDLSIDTNVGAMTDYDCKIFCRLGTSGVSSILEDTSKYKAANIK